FPKLLTIRIIPRSRKLIIHAIIRPLYAAYWMSVVYEHWSFCRYAKDAIFISSYVLCGVSLMTMTAISVDRLLAMLLGLRYEEIVTLRRTHIILAIVWVVCLVAGLFSYLIYRIGLWYRIIIILSGLVISAASYTKIFRALRHHQAQIQDHVQQQPNQPNALDIARYRKAVYNAIWMHLALVVCYVPQFTVNIVIFLSAKRFSNFFLICGMATVLIFFNSTLNPFLYCWKIINILFSITATLGNSLILVALHKESSLNPPSKLLYRCLATTDLLVGLVTQPLCATYWMSLVHEHWSLCRYVRNAIYISGYALCGVSLSTLTAISVDRLLALLLGLRYKDIVTLRRTYIILAIFWVVCLAPGLFSLLNYRITFWCSFIAASSCLVISIASYTKIFCALSHHQAQVQDHAQQQVSQSITLNMARYRKAVYNALWVQLALVVLLFNSTLNPLLYCWKISEVRQAVKQTIRQVICYA
ncbi:unnamed protein product, partial [Pocillopora meandrina]